MHQGFSKTLDWWSFPTFMNITPSHSTRSCRKISGSSIITGWSHFHQVLETLGGGAGKDREKETKHSFHYKEFNPKNRRCFVCVTRGQRRCAGSPRRFGAEQLPGKHLQSSTLTAAQLTGGAEGNHRLVPGRRLVNNRQRQRSPTMGWSQRHRRCGSSWSGAAAPTTNVDNRSFMLLGVTPQTSPDVRKFQGNLNNFKYPSSLKMIQQLRPFEITFPVLLN